MQLEMCCQIKSAVVDFFVSFAKDERAQPIKKLADLL